MPRALCAEKGATPDEGTIAYRRIAGRSSPTGFVRKHLLGCPGVKNHDGSWTEWGNLGRAPTGQGWDLRWFWLAEAPCPRHAGGMARVKGRAGGTLLRKIAVALAILLGAAASAGIVGRLLSPYLAWPLTVFASAFLLKLALEDKAFRQAFRAKAKGLLGERRVGTLLEGLPEGWRVFHDVDLGGENADHVVVGPPGVFSIEVKNYAGQVVARPDGLFVNGRRQDRIVRQAWRQARKLEAVLGVEVQPVLVFAGGAVEGTRAGRLPVLTPEGLLEFLRESPRRLNYAEARRIFQALSTRLR